MAEANITEKYTENFINMFREYDIRGRISEDELNDQHVYDIVRAYTELLRRRGIDKAIVGYDNRPQSESFAQAAIKALVEAGIDVTYIGLALSPVMYYAQYHYQCEGGVMITASHNPAGWSGFKLACGYSKTLESQDIKEVLAILLNDEVVPYEGEPGTVTVDDVRPAYIDQIVNRINMGPNPPRVVVDAGNGGAGVFAYELFNRLGCMTFQLNCDPDFTYPHYFPNPSDLTERARLREVVTHPYIKADLGIGFDGDGDRIGVVDDKGENVWSDTILAILVKHMIEKDSGAEIVYDVKCSQTLEEVIKAQGAKPCMWKTGHSYIKRKMQEDNAPLAGERSGHLFFGGDFYYGFDDASFAAAKLVEYLSWQKDCSLSSIVDTMPRYIASPEINAYCSDSEKYQVVDELVALFKEQYPGRVNDINGARVQFEHGWGLVRASSNLPQLVLIFEGDTQEHMLEIRQIFKDVLANFPQIAQEWDNDVVLDA